MITRVSEWFRGAWWIWVLRDGQPFMFYRPAVQDPPPALAC